MFINTNFFLLKNSLTEYLAKQRKIVSGNGFEKVSVLFKHRQFGYVSIFFFNRYILLTDIYIYRHGQEHVNQIIWL